MKLSKLHDFNNEGIMQVAGFMSGSGSNLTKIIEHEQKLKEERGESPYHVAVIFSDRYNSKANEIGKRFDLPVITRDIEGFYAKRGLSDTRYKLNPLVREEFDFENVRSLAIYGCHSAALAGYMSAVTDVVTDTFLTVNVHPANLSIMDNGKRKYRGEKAMIKQIIGKEKELRATTHIVIPEIDQGRILMISAPIEVKLPEGFNYDDECLVETVAEGYQESLKKVGDWVIFPRTLEYIAMGRYTEDGKGNLYFDDFAIPNGVRL